MKKIIKEMKRLIRKWMLTENAKRLKWYFSEHLNNDHYRIHKFRVSERRNHYLIKIQLECPGIFIGLKGSNIIRLSNELERYIGKEIIFKIEEFNPLSNLYY